MPGYWGLAGRLSKKEDNNKGQHRKKHLCCPLDGCVDIAGIQTDVFVHYAVKCVEFVKIKIAN